MKTVNQIPLNLYVLHYQNEYISQLYIAKNNKNLYSELNPPNNLTESRQNKTSFEN